MVNLPRISIITPSFNQGNFIEQTILSVVNQNYPNLQYIIIDGGSTDNSMQIIEKYRDYIDFFISEPDNGQSDAINKGLKKVTGDWFNWLNSDDILMPNALFALSHAVIANPSYNWISGGKINLNSEGHFGASELPWQTDPGFFIANNALFPQDATYIRTSFYRTHNLLIRDEYINAMDTVLYYELLKIEKPLLTTMIFSGMRWHENQKSAVSQNLKRENEGGRVLFSEQPDLLQKLFIRLRKTRFNVMVDLIIKIFIWHGWIKGVKNWDVYYFDHWANSFVLGKAHKKIKY